jgi:trans-aconitate 2-methyltransferase
MWSPDVYLKFAGHRTRPALELAARAGPVRGLIYDLGCGPGNSTAILASLNPDAKLIGVDSSQDMLDRAAIDGPKDAQWANRDLSTWKIEDPADLVFSNATYQWLDDHEALFPSLLRAVKPGGALAIQMPQNFAAPSHVLMRKIASEGRWSERLTPLLRHNPVGSPEKYYEIFAPLVAKGDGGEVDIWETEYAQVLNGDDPVFSWVSGTALRPLLAVLDEGEQEIFARQYKEALNGAYPKREDGKTLFSFKRIFMVIRR